MKIPPDLSFLLLLPPSFSSMFQAPSASLSLNSTLPQLIRPHLNLAPRKMWFQAAKYDPSFQALQYKTLLSSQTTEDSSYQCLLRPLASFVKWAMLHREGIVMIHIRWQLWSYFGKYMNVCSTQNSRQVEQFSRKGGKPDAELQVQASRWECSDSRWSPSPHFLTWRVKQQSLCSFHLFL